ncbi:tyrosine-type recombinase/integrase [Rhodococcus sp. NPDC019627]|uniref:tyrosine-type recombinase/integrase n=1 Tax=unclassified Rhodococcus (in: high G+C Gram-positive bacteria) TaxID=192944 RepID=UPI0033F6356C
MLTHRAVTSVTDTQVLSLHRRSPASRTPRWESSTSNATRTRPHTATADTRHSYATRLLRKNTPIEVVSALLGHSSIATTMDIYGHLSVEDARRALEAAGFLTGQEVRW